MVSRKSRLSGYRDCLRCQPLDPAHRGCQIPRDQVLAVHTAARNNRQDWRIACSIQAIDHLIPGRAGLLPASPEFSPDAGSQVPGRNRFRSSTPASPTTPMMISITVHVAKVCRMLRS